MPNLNCRLICALSDRRSPHRRRPSRGVGVSTSRPLIDMWIRVEITLPDQRTRASHCSDGSLQNGTELASVETSRFTCKPVPAKWSVKSAALIQHLRRNRNRKQSATVDGGE